MFCEFVVPLPDRGIRLLQRADGTRVYSLPAEGEEILIGKVCPDDPGMMFPAPGYLAFASSGSRPSPGALRLQVLPWALSVCALPEGAGIRTDLPVCFFSRTDEECSLVCRSADVPDSAIRREDGWMAFRVAGPLDFSLVGILSGIASVLAARGIPLFAVSTYNTDYILIRSVHLPSCVSALASEGYEWIRTIHGGLT